MVVSALVEFVVAERCTDDIAAQAIGIFNGGTPVVFFNDLFAVAVLALEEIELGSGSRAHKAAFLVGSNRGEHHCAVVLGLVEDAVAWVHEIACAKDSGFGHYEVGIVEATIDNGNRHTFTAEAHFVELVGLEHFGLAEAATVVFMAVGVVG